MERLDAESFGLVFLWVVDCIASGSVECEFVLLLMVAFLDGDVDGGGSVWLVLVVLVL